MDKKNRQKDCKQLSDLRDEIDRLKLELDERQLIEKATGLIAGTKGVTEKEARALLKDFSRELNKSLIEAAGVILLGNRILKPLPPAKNRGRKKGPA